MSIKKFLTGSLTFALVCSAACFATATPDAMRGASAIQQNAKLSNSVSLIKDPSSNIIGFHVNGINSSDAEILLMKTAAPLSTEYTAINGTTKDGTSCSFMLPTNVATALIVEQISKDLVNGGAVSISITKQTTGQS